LASILFLFVFFAFSLSSIILLYKVADFSSSSAVLYFLRDHSGGYHVTNDLAFDEADHLVFMIDMSGVLNFLEGVASSAKKEPILELDWSERNGRGLLREFRPDGSKFLAVLSRYNDSGHSPKGLFVGGDLPFGDSDRLKDKSRNNTGISYFDGGKWIHVWCSANEALQIEGFSDLLTPPQWEYVRSDVIKNTSEEILITSRHRFDGKRNDGEAVSLIMTRTLHKKAGDDFLVLRVEYTNIGKTPIQYNYIYGDEPWVGEFGNSGGDIGWARGKVFKRESYLLPIVDSFAGIWDRGNELVGEEHKYSGYANFVEWISNPPTMVAFSNSLSIGEFREGRPLDHKDSRVINLFWLSEILNPRYSRSYILALGMAKPDPLSGKPQKPVIDFVRNMY